MDTFSLVAPDGVALHGCRWLPAGTPHAQVQLVHGMAEHVARYDQLAQALCAAGYAVYGHDLRGHGQTAPRERDLGYLGDGTGWRTCLEDIARVRGRMNEEGPGLPLFLLGHSMGAFLARQSAAENGDGLAGLVLSGSYLASRGLAWAGGLIARLERLRLGPRGRSPLIRRLTFDAFNRRFAPARANFDWLSRDPAEVDRYAADPCCGFEPSIQLWIELLDALAAGLPIPAPMPVCLLVGELDPVCEPDPSGIKLAAALRAGGMDRVAHCVYPDARHELFHETNRDEVTSDLLAWMDQVVAMGRDAKP